MGGWNSKPKSSNTSFFVLYLLLVLILQWFFSELYSKSFSLELQTSTENVGSMVLNDIVDYLQVKVPEPRVAIGRISCVE